MRIKAFSVMAGAVAMLAFAFPGEALALNDHTPEWDKVWMHLLIDVGVIGAIFLVVSIYFLLSYTRKSEGEVGKLKQMSFGNSLAWALIPAFIFMADDFYLAAQGWNLWNSQRRVPEGAYEIQVTGRMWGWDFAYPNGAMSSSDVEYDETGLVTGIDGDGLVVAQGTPVVLRMSSADVVHSFFIPDFRIKEDLMPGRITYLWFNPKDAGEHVYTCTEFCGLDHSRMYGKVKILPQPEFDAWLASKSEE
ncbi:MAG: hypothetical protein OEZ32_01865 [Nitrospinota bacterium]|nr:hypothetical protein [Nitrospinota bacterium]